MVPHTYIYNYPEPIIKCLSVSKLEIYLCLFSSDVSGLSIRLYCSQNLISKYLDEHPANAVAFVESVLSQLNWAFSEFVSMLQEIQTAHNRPER